jgi:hypothetical protein
MPHGFTRLEISVSIVMATIVVVAISVIFKSVEQSAGNARAADRILAFRQAVEEVASQAGAYPTVAQMREVWARQASGSFLFSPWGGHVGPELDEATGSRGIAQVAFFDIPGRGAPIPGRAGGIGYMTGSMSEREVKIYDAARNLEVRVHNYGCFFYDPKGSYPHFAVGGTIR